MKIEKKTNGALKLLRESAAGSYYAFTKFYAEEDRTEYEVIKGPRQQVMDYMVETTVDFIIENLGQDVDYSVFAIGPSMVNTLSDNTNQSAVDQAIKELFNFKEPIYVTSSLNASDFAVDYMDENGEATEEDEEYGYDVDKVLDTKEFKDYLTKKFRIEVEAGFRNYFEN
jgi:hypothetical protein